MAKVSNGNPKKVCQWYDEGSNHTFREGDIIKVYDEEEPNYGLDEDYRIVKIDLNNEIMECVLLDKNGRIDKSEEEIGFYEFLFDWVMTPEQARKDYPECFPIGEETKAGIDAFLTEYEHTLQCNTSDGTPQKLTQEDAIELLGMAVKLMREIVG